MNKKIIMWQGNPSHILCIDNYLFWSMFMFTVIFFSTWDNNNWVSITQKIPVNYVYLISLSLLMLPLFRIVTAYLTIRSTKYQLTKERLITKTGILSTELNELELYRIKDYSITSPFFQRIFKLGTIVLDTSDKSHPVLSLNAIKNPEYVLDILRGQVEELRISKNVREIDH